MRCHDKARGIMIDWGHAVMLTQTGPFAYTVGPCFLRTVNLERRRGHRRLVFGALCGALPEPVRPHGGTSWYADLDMAQARVNSLSSRQLPGDDHSATRPKATASNPTTNTTSGSIVFLSNPPDSAWMRQDPSVQQHDRSTTPPYNIQVSPDRVSPSGSVGSARLG